MTRINTIDPTLLLDQHLVAEWREMPRIVNELRKHPQRFKLDDIPSEYTLNKGHVKFFRNKLIFLQKRHQLLCDEMDARGINRNPDICIDFNGLDDNIAKHAMNDYTPTNDAHRINIERLRERFEMRKKPYTFKGKKVDCERTWDEYYKLLSAKYFESKPDGYIKLNGCNMVTTINGLFNAMRDSDKPIMFNMDIYKAIDEIAPFNDIPKPSYDANTVLLTRENCSTLDYLYHMHNHISEYGISDAISKCGNDALKMYSMLSA